MFDQLNVEKSARPTWSKAMHDAVQQELFTSEISRAANHNVTSAMRDANVIILPYRKHTDDFLPDIGARCLSAA